jgi:hypothetical protein
MAVLSGVTCTWCRHLEIKPPHLRRIFLGEGAYIVVKSDGVPSVS